MERKQDVEEMILVHRLYFFPQIQYCGILTDMLFYHIVQICFCIILWFKFSLVRHFPFGFIVLLIVVFLSIIYYFHLYWFLIVYIITIIIIIINSSIIILENE